MIKHFCDNCGVEIDSKNKFGCKEVKIDKHVIKIGFIEEPPREDALCKYCVIKAVEALDDRPKDECCMSR